MTNSPSDQIGKKPTFSAEAKRRAWELIKPKEEQGSSRDQSPSTTVATLASELAGQRRSVSGAERLPTPRFGDVVENAWASIDNPTRVGFFVREIRRTARVTNPGRWFEVTDGRGKFWQVMADRDHKTTVTSADVRLTRREFDTHIAEKIMALGALEVLIDSADAFETNPDGPGTRNPLLKALEEARDVLDIISNRGAAETHV